MNVIYDGWNGGKMFSGDLAQVTAQWLGEVHPARCFPDIDPNRRAMYYEIVALLKQPVFGGRDVDQELDLLGQRQLPPRLDHKRVDQLASDIRQAMREDDG